MHRIFLSDRIGWLSLIGVCFCLGANAQIVSNQAADLVLGKSNFYSSSQSVSESSIFDPFSVVVDPASGKVFVGDNTANRVLRFSSAWALRNGVSAEIVLGQPDFTDTTKGLSERDFNRIGGLAITPDGRLFVVDNQNHRILRFDNAATIATYSPANAVLGQANFTSRLARTTQDGLRDPKGISFDANGNLYVADEDNHRVLRYNNAVAKPNGATADFVLGQANFTTSTVRSTSQNSFNESRDVLIVGDRLYVGDVLNNRILRFDNISTLVSGSNPNANGVFGAPNFTDPTPGLSNTELQTPRGLAYHDATDRLYVADQANHRVVWFNNPGTASVAPVAAGVLGASDFTDGTLGRTERELFNPRGGFVDGFGNLWIAEASNGRVLRFSPPPTLTSFTPTSGAPGTVITLTGTNLQSATGWVSFGPAVSAGVTATSYTQAQVTVPDGAVSGRLVYHTPSGAAVSATNFTATAPLVGNLTEGQPADLVLGQPDFTAIGTQLNERGWNASAGVAIDPTSGKVFVADFNNNRVLRFANYNSLVTGASAEAVLGQPDFVTNAAPDPPTRTSMRLPQVVWVDAQGRLFVCDVGNNRVLRFDNAASVPTNALASVVFGQTGFTTRTSGSGLNQINGLGGIVVTPDGYMFVAVSGRKQVYRYAPAVTYGNTNGASAELAIGDGLDQIDNNSFKIPQGLAYDPTADVLYVADISSNRVVRVATPRGSTPTFSAVLGQAGFMTGGAATTQVGLSGPECVAVSPSGRLYIGEAGNNRIVWHDGAATKPSGAAADGQVGQPNFTTNTAVTPATQNSIAHPDQLAIDAFGRLYAASLTQHRVVRFSPSPTLTAISPTSGPPGTQVTLTGTQFQQNNGGAVYFGDGPATPFRSTGYTTATVTVPQGATTGPVTLVKPGGSATGPVFTVTAPASEGLVNFQPANLVLGQTGFTATTAGPGLNQLNAPASVAIDPTTGQVFVCDMGNNRVMRYASAAARRNGAPGTQIGTLGTTQSSFRQPSSIFIDAGGRLFVEDWENNRVLRFDSPTTATSSTNANCVFGQPNYNSNTAGAGTTGMRGPRSVFVDPSGTLYVGDNGNNRVLVYTNASTRVFTVGTAIAADKVLGQPDFATTSVVDPPTATSLRAPQAMAYHAATNTLFVTDGGNHRVLRYTNVPAKPNGAAADGVLGQPNFTSRVAQVSASGLNNPECIALAADGRLYVGDASNNRVLWYDNAVAKPNGAAADGVLGQPSFTTRSSFNDAVSATTIEYPDGMALDLGGNLWVVAANDHRALRFATTPPTLLTVSPTEGVVGTTVTLTGTNLAASGTLTFGGAIIPADSITYSADYSTATFKMLTALPLGRNSFAYREANSPAVVAGPNFLLRTTPAKAPTPAPAFAGTVNALATDGTYTYVGGRDISLAGSNTNNFAVLEPSLSHRVVAASTSYPWSSDVTAVVPDPSGGWWVFSGSSAYRVPTSGAVTTLFLGTFSNNWAAVADGVNYVYCAPGDGTGFLRRIDRRTNALDPAWLPGVTGAITALAIDPSGTYLYVGGSFTALTPLAGAGSARARLARISLRTGLVDPTWPTTAPNNAVEAIAVVGTDAFIGGSFTDYGGVGTRDGIAKVSVSTGAIATGWLGNGGLSAGTSVTALLVRGTDLYAGGNFTTLGGVPRTRLAKLSQSDGTVDATWAPVAATTVAALAQTTATVYAAAGATVSELDPATGASRVLPGLYDSFTPYVSDLAVNGSGQLALGGNFTQVGGMNPYTSAPDYDLRRYLTETGEFDASWGINVGGTGTVHALAVAGGYVYVGGLFATGSRQNLARMSTSATGFDAWNPNATGAVFALATNPTATQLYVGGSFTSINNTVATTGTGSAVTRNRLALFNLPASTSQYPALASWAPNQLNLTGSIVYSLAVDANSVYAGGTFAKPAGADPAANDLLRLSVGAGTQQPFVSTSGTSDTVRVLQLVGAELYVGGRFTELATVSRKGLARLNNLSGTPAVDAGWNPFPENLSNRVDALAIGPAELLVGGNYLSYNNGTTYTDPLRLTLPTPTPIAWTSGVAATANVFAALATPTGYTFGGSFGLGTYRAPLTTTAVVVNPVAGITTTGFDASWLAPGNAQLYGVRSYDFELVAGAVTPYAPGNYITFAGATGRQTPDFSESLQATVSGLLPNRRYRFRVRGQGYTEPTAYSNELEVVTLPTPPAVTTPVVSDVTESSVTVRWQAAEGTETESYSVQRGNPTGAFVTAATQTAGAAAVASTFTGLAPNTQYRFTVATTNASGTSVYSAPTGVVLTRPAAPTLGTATALLTTGTGFTARWNQPTGGCTGYKLQVSLQTNFAALAIPEVTISGAATVSQAVSGLLPNRTYYYRVRATNATGDGPFLTTGTTFTTVVTLPVAPALPAVGSQATNLSDVSFTANWLPADGTATSFYTVETSLFDAVPFSALPVQSTVNPTTSLGVTGLTGNTRYKYRVFTVNSSGASNLPSAESASVLTKPNPVTNFQIATALVNGARVSWTPPTGGAEGYTIYVGNTPGFLVPIVPAFDVTNGAATFFEVTSSNFVQGPTYYIRMAAKNTSGESSFAPDISFQVLPPQSVGSAQNLAISNTTFNGFRVNWDRGSGGIPTYYDLQLQAAGGNPLQYLDSLGNLTTLPIRISQTGGTSFQVNVTGLMTLTNYTIKIVSVGSNVAETTLITASTSPCPGELEFDPVAVTYCDNGSPITLTSPAAESYEWYRNDVIIENATERVLQVAISGTYKVKVTNPVPGCSGLVAPKVLPFTLPSGFTLPIVNPSPDLLTFGFSGSNPPAASTYTQRWFYKPTPTGVSYAIVGASGPTYTPLVSGDYRVQVTTNSQGCRLNSGSVTITKTGQAQVTYLPGGWVDIRPTGEDPAPPVVVELSEGSVEVFPNPSAGRITVQSLGAPARAIQAEIRSLQGARVYVSPELLNTERPSAELVLEHLPAGTYYLLLSDGQNLVVKPIQLTY